MKPEAGFHRRPSFMGFRPWWRFVGVLAVGLSISGVGRLVRGDIPDARTYLILAAVSVAIGLVILRNGVPWETWPLWGFPAMVVSAASEGSLRSLEVTVPLAVLFLAMCEIRRRLEANRSRLALRSR